MVNKAAFIEETVRASQLYSNHEAEKIVLAAIMLEIQEVDGADYIGRLTPDHFVAWRPGRVIFESIRNLHKRGETFGYIEMQSELRRTQTEVTVEDLHIAISTWRGAYQAEPALKIVEENYRRIQIMGIAELIANRAAYEDASQLAALARNKLDTIIDGGRIDNSDLCELVKKISDRMDGPKTAFKAFPTGFGRLDYLLGGGLRKGQLVAIGARTSHGKTAFGISNVALSCARVGRKVTIVSLEMPDDELAARFISSISAIPVQVVIQSQIDESDMGRFVRASSEAANLPVRIYTPRNKRLSNLVCIVRQTVRRDGAEIVFIDYLQLIRHDDHRINRVEAVADITGTMKSLAMELEIPVVVLGQLNRTADGIKPRSAHFRESGSIEQDADVSMLLYRPDNENGEPQDVGEIIIDKNRNGPKGNANVIFIGDSCSFEQTIRKIETTTKRRSK